MNNLENNVSLFQEKGLDLKDIMTYKKVVEAFNSEVVDNRPVLNPADKHISSYSGYEYGVRIINPYDIFEDQDNTKYVRMFIKENVYVFFDYEDISKILYKDNDTKKRVPWSLSGSGYVQGHYGKNPTYMHHVVMNFKGSGRGFQQESVDHINRNRLNNRKSNLRLATAKQQQDNSKGVLQGTKRERKYSAKLLPEGITQEMLPKYVTYYNQGGKEFFTIEDHPIILGKIKINGHEIKNMKSIQALWVDQYADPRVPYPIMDKLNEIKEKLKALDDLLRSNPDAADIIVEETSVIKSLYEKRKAKNTKKVYKYDENNNLVCVYDSIVKTAQLNNVAETTIRRAIKGEKLCQGYYYKNSESDESESDENENS